jgi:hypothetical protein
VLAPAGGRERVEYRAMPGMAVHQPFRMKLHAQQKGGSAAEFRA